jgi:flagellar biosynthesis protein FliQ
LALYIKLLHAAFAAELFAITPIVAVLLIIGLAMAVLQSALQIEDATFSLLPKTFAMIAIALTGGFGALRVFENLAVLFIGHVPMLVHQPWN